MLVAMPKRNRTLENDGRKDPEWRPLCHRFCHACIRILSKSDILDAFARGQDSEDDAKEQWEHHQSLHELQRSAESGCHLCSLLYTSTCDISSDWPDHLTQGQQRLDIKRWKNSSPEIILAGNHPYPASEGLKVGARWLGNGSNDHKRPSDIRDIGQRALYTNSTASDTTMNTVKEWLQDCFSNHIRCR